MKNFEKSTKKQLSVMVFFEGVGGLILSLLTKVISVDDI